MAEITVESLASMSLLTPSQRQQLDSSIKHSEFLATRGSVTGDDGVEVVVMDNVDVAEARRCAARDRQMLEAGTPPEYSSADKNRINAIRKVLEERMTHTMLSQDQMERPLPDHIDRHIAWSNLYEPRDAPAWKNACRILDPSNDGPNFTSIERLRTNTPPKGDPRKYWQGFDAIKWADTIEADLLENLDDEQYLQFMEYKLLGWTKTSICKALGFNTAMYDAAMERLRQSIAAREAEELRGAPAESAMEAEASVDDAPEAAEPEAAEPEVMPDHAVTAVALELNPAQVEYTPEFEHLLLYYKPDRKKPIMQNWPGLALKFLGLTHEELAHMLTLRLDVLSEYMRGQKRWPGSVVHHARQALKIAAVEKGIGIKKGD